MKPDPTDKRHTMISVPPPTEDLGATLHAMGRKITRQTLKPLTHAEQKTLLRILTKMV